MNASRLKRWAIGSGGGAVLLLSAVGYVKLSDGAKNRYPGDDPAQAIPPRVAPVVTKSAVNALGRQIDRCVQELARRTYMDTGLTVPEIIPRFLDDRVDLARRRIFAYRLARIGSPECIAALLKVLATAPPEHKAFMAQLIGSTGNSAAKEWLWPLLDDPDESVRTAAIHGLSAIGGDEVMARLAGVLADTRLSDRSRIEAALGLGTIGTPAARDALVEALARAPAGDVGVQVLNSLGRFHFAAIADPFAKYLAAPVTPGAMRCAAAEALANSSTEAVPFLLRLAESDSDADVRAAAAWAISAHVPANDRGPSLARLIESEPQADVRRRLYEALLPQAAIPAGDILAKVLAEKDTAARVAGFNAIGRGAYQQPESAIAAVFDQQIVPELQQIATAPNTLNLQMRAVFALRRAQTPAATAALLAIAGNARPQVATAARNGLRTPRT